MRSPGQTVLGVRHGTRFHCPKCRGGRTKVVLSHDPGDGVMVRRRRCEGCGYCWYTAQEPEYLLRAEQVKYLRDERGSCRPYIRDAATEEPCDLGQLAGRSIETIAQAGTG